MELRSIIRTIIAALVGLGLLVLVIVLIAKVFSGHGGTPERRINVGSYANTPATATLLIDGYTNLDQNHRQVKIIVNNSSSEINIIQGYQGKVIASQTYANNSTAYGQFLQSLQLLGFSRGSDVNIDQRGYCPTGSRFTYSFSDNQSDLFSYWSTSCGGQGTFHGNPAGVRQLFERQIPQKDFSQLTGGLDITL